jgi:UrcA family protein
MERKIMKESNLRKVQIVASFALIIGAPLVAKSANYSFEQDSGALRVSYSDLDINSDDGISVLYSRLQDASRGVCETGSYQSKGSVKAVVESNKCYSRLLSRVVASVGSDKLTALHNS